MSTPTSTYSHPGFRKKLIYGMIIVVLFAIMFPYTEQLAKVKIIYLGTHANPTSAAAAVVLAGRTLFEKSGTLINQQFRIQKFAAAVPGNPGSEDDLVILSKLIPAVGGTFPSALAAVWTALAAEVPALAGLSHATLPETGKTLDGSPWGNLPYPEGETLHYKPKAAPKAFTASMSAWSRLSGFPRRCTLRRFPAGPATCDTGPTVGCRSLAASAWT